MARNDFLLSASFIANFAWRIGCHDLRPRQIDGRGALHPVYAPPHAGSNSMKDQSLATGSGRGASAIVRRPAERDRCGSHKLRAACAVARSPPIR